MNTKLVSQEEQITEYNERIAAVEEELKRVSLSTFCIFMNDDHARVIAQTLH